MTAIACTILTTTLSGSASSGTDGAERSGAAVGQAAVSSTAEDIRDLERAAPERCPSARRGLRFYRMRARDGATMRGTTRPVTRMGRAPRNCADARYLAVVWRGRSFVQRQRTETWLYHYAWWLWMPANWQALGACETGYGRRPGNFNHANSSYVSAFGISRREYDADAAYFGTPPWNDRHPPTPRQQLAAARGHLARFGDGWGCPGP